MHTVWLMAIAAATFASTAAGGLLALSLRDRLHLVLGFSAGAVIGVAFFDLLPEALELGLPYLRADELLAVTACGFLVYLVLDRVLSFHGDARHRGAFTAAILCLHSLLDGIAVGLAFQASRNVGIIVAIAVLTHDFSDGINTMNVVIRSGGDRARALKWLTLDAAAPAAGMASSTLFSLPGGGFGAALALFGGFFLYIGASDLIPESYHAHPKFLTSAMTLAGAGALFVAVRLLG
jgi:ZIP family zinc transporter